MPARILILLILPFLLLPGGCRSKKKLRETNEPRILEARQLMEEAGYPGGEGFPKITLLYNTSESHKKVAAVVQQMWKEDLGIRVELANKEWKVYLDELTGMNYQVARRGWIGDYPDPHTFIELMSSTSGNNNTGWKNAEYDELIHESDRELDPRKRMELLQKAEEILLHDMPVIPIYFYVSQTMYRPDQIKGIHPNLQNIHPLNEVVKGDGKGTFILNNGTEVATLDPGIARGVPEHRVQMALFEGLMNYDPKTLEPVPGVAKKYDMSKDGKTYTFHLRDCTWSDGKPVRAQDFEYAWKRMLDPKTASDYAHLIYFVKGAQKFNEGKGKAEEVGVTAKDEKTLVVELNHPTSYFKYLFPFFTLYPVRKDVIEKHKLDWTKPGKFVGNGPFQLKEWVVNEFILLEKNPKYWNAAKVKQSRVKWLPTENLNTAFNMYEKGQCDYLDSTPLEYIEELEKRKDFHRAPYLGTYYYSFNITKKPFDDPMVRRALALAIDRKIICEKILKGGQTPAYAFVPPVPLFGAKGFTSKPFSE
jgi:ABC-type oligopeptide transport system substrate-binding subunit